MILWAKAFEERFPPPAGDHEGRPYYGRAWQATSFMRSIVGATLLAVILSAAKDLRSAQREILRCAQDDSLDE